MNKPTAFIFFGISGSGKGTQAELLINHLREKDPSREVVYVETGGRLRNFVANNSGYTRDKVNEILENGLLLPEFIPVWLWTDLMAKSLTGKEYVVLDGVARRFHEAPVLEGALNFYGYDKPNVLLINVSKKWAKERLKARGRSDDDDAEIERRFSWFDENTKPAIDYFKNSKNANFLEISGEQTIKEVHAEVLRKTGLSE